MFFPILSLKWRGLDFLCVSSGVHGAAALLENFCDGILSLMFKYRYEGKNKSLMYDVTKIVAALKPKRGDHRVFRLAENLCMNLIFSLRDFFSVKKEGKVQSSLWVTI